MKIFDSHFHILSIIKKDLLYSLPENLIGIDVSASVSDIEERIKLIPNKNVFLSIGAGPWELNNKDFISVDKLIENLEFYFNKYSADAIGEYGFDNYWKYGKGTEQQELFEKETEFAKKRNLVKIIHLREADKECLENINAFDEKTILHSYSSSEEVLRPLLDKGVYVSFSGNITYKGNDKIREALKIVPLDRLLYETDSPYLSPVPLRGTINKPENDEVTLSFISSLINKDKEELKEICINNFYTLFGYKESKVNRFL